MMIKITKSTVLIVIAFILVVGCLNVYASEEVILTSSDDKSSLDEILSDFDLSVCNTVWDVDFEDHQLSEENGGNICNSEGVAITNDKGGIFQVNSGSANSSFSIENYSGATEKNNEKSLHAIIKGYDEVKLNECQVDISSNVAIFNYDYSTENLASDEYMGYVRFYKEDGTTVDSPQIRLGGNGNIWIHGVTVLKQINASNASEWINVGLVYDFSTSMYYVYIDGEQMYSQDLSSYNISKTYKLIISTKGGYAAYSGEYWVDNINVVEAKSKNNIISATNEKKSFDLTFKNSVSMPDKEDIKITFGSNTISVESVEQISDNVIRVNTVQDIFTGVYIDISIKDVDLNEFMTYRHLSDTEDFDISGMIFTQNDNVISASATVVNVTDTPRNVTMIMTLRDENRDAISLIFTPVKEFSESDEISISAEIGNAKYADILFIDDFDNCHPVKNIRFEHQIN